ncbi:MAG: hypothetical protein Fur0037_21600 [Planctomycetota bacterium]
MKHRREIFECPNCGADVPIGRRACPECGSDENTGWQDAEQIEYKGLDLPEGYSVDPEHPGRSVERHRPSPIVVLLALLAAGSILWLAIRGWRA